MAKVADIHVGIGAKTEDLKRGLNDAGNKLNDFGKQVKNIAGALGIAFGAREIAKFGLELIKLGGQAQGVRSAFNNLNDITLLDHLKKATRDTVSELALMRYAVQAKNFKIPLDQLATYFEFATKRALQTGESVDYLVQSIITGIGRKSVLVMDNLGISAVELQNEFERMGDFGSAAGEIIRRELKSMGDVADTTNTKIAQLSTSWDDLKTSVGEIASPLVLNWFDFMTKKFDIWKREAGKFLVSNEIVQLLLVLKAITEGPPSTTRIGPIPGGLAGGATTATKPSKPGFPPLSGLGIGAAGAMPSADVFEYFKKELPKVTAEYEASMERINEANKNVTRVYTEESSKFVTTFDAAAKRAKEIAENLENAMTQLKEGVTAAFIDLGSDIAYSFGEMLAGVSGAFDDLGMQLAQFAKRISGLLIAFGILTGNPLLVGVGIALGAGASIASGYLSGVNNPGGGANINNGRMQVEVTGSTKISGNDMAVVYGRGNSNRNGLT